MGVWHNDFDFDVGGDLDYYYDFNVSDSILPDTSRSRTRDSTHYLGVLCRVFVLCNL